MEVDQDRIGVAPQRAGRKLALGDRERIVERLHVGTSHQVHHQRAAAVMQIDQRAAAPRGAGRKIRRPDQAFRALDEHHRLALVEGVVAERHRIGAGCDHLLIDRFIDAEAAGCVLAVDDEQVDFPLRAELWNMGERDLAPGTADEIAEEEDTHAYVKPRRAPDCNG
jgi:hypothetical protein